ncbi:MAG: hypothetical protein IJ810_01475 [Candidatus Methanomethylophilus sp.]|nr:hypothetical protein [Methanomethylophilus sp.]
MTEIVQNDTIKKVKVIENSTKTSGTISGFFKFVRFDNGGASASFVIDPTLLQAFAIRQLNLTLPPEQQVRLTDNQEQLVKYGTMKFTRDDIVKLQIWCVDFLEATKNQQEAGKKN